jgi:hypothetical protein
MKAECVISARFPTRSACGQPSGKSVLLGWSISQDHREQDAPCHGTSDTALIEAIAVAHAEIILIHPLFTAGRQASAASW